jgi:hypothetical protein
MKGAAVIVQAKPLGRPGVGAFIIAARRIDVAGEIDHDIVGISGRQRRIHPVGDATTRRRNRFGAHQCDHLMAGGHELRDQHPPNLASCTCDNDTRHSLPP